MEMFITLLLIGGMAALRVIAISKIEFQTSESRVVTCPKCGRKIRRGNFAPHCNHCNVTF